MNKKTQASFAEINESYKNFYRSMTLEELER